ncbi:uncharacterized protein A1O9_09382 [Exophiala aquamarina CBS 119918]|uniref:Xylanolytic transcriptional activator regulatory domain-containing protein n=1 Tax=Exophiala aquamarina CBS 119918 TaxID=1182545 RepID=A0A072P4B7_9EURO|nr:uncharacterized protein A1O9_09382 [Exophiala aquamarina CBS 119918]KEF54939.1 hypothetical protein A1O9_09382 [Exophiala aquamarina CBS 119918]
MDSGPQSPLEPASPPKPQTDAIYADLIDDDAPIPTQEQGSTVLYVGNPLHNLSYTVGQRRLSDPQRPLHYFVVGESATGRVVAENEAPRTLTMSNNDHLPPKAVQDELVRIYFSVFQPSYPFLDRSHFIGLYNTGEFTVVGSSRSLSLMLLQAVFLTAFTHCSTSVVQSAGFQSRIDAKVTYFRRTKALWDAALETDRLINIQVLLLLQFWWDSPTEQKDSIFWLNMAISLAQGCGMHRSTACSGLPDHQRRLWTRIWACLRLRDAQLATALGRPLHLHSEDCDVEPLDVSIFLEDNDLQMDEPLVGRSTHLEKLYFLNMSKLSNIAGLISQGHRPRGADGKLAEARTTLREWYQSLETELQLGAGYHVEFWVKFLHIYYK